MSIPSSFPDLLLSAKLVERALREPAHEAALAAHFGDALFTRLRHLADVVQGRALGAAAPRVLIIPGLPGTGIGTRRAGVDDPIWFGLGNVLAGRLAELANAPSSPPFVPLEVIAPVYLQLKLRLHAAGYDVDYHPFDWRRSVIDLGRDLAERIRREPGEVHLVAHSFGGIVARAAVALGAPNLGRVVLLGAANHGTFVALQGIRGSHWILRTLSALDPFHTAAELGAVLGTFPSMYEQIPSHAKLAPLDLFDPAAWPTAGPRPDAGLLRGAPLAQDLIATARGQIFIVAGHGHPTVDGVESRDGAFVYHRTTAGDGWASEGFAELEGVPCHYTQASHIGMTNAESVIDATLDLLADGRTTRLPTVRPGSERLPDVSDVAPAEPPFSGRRGLELTAEDLRAALDQLLSVVPGFID